MLYKNEYEVLFKLADQAAKTEEDINQLDTAIGLVREQAFFALDSLGSCMEMAVFDPPNSEEGPSNSEEGPLAGPGCGYTEAYMAKTIRDAGESIRFLVSLGFAATRAGRQKRGAE